MLQKVCIKGKVMKRWKYKFVLTATEIIISVFPPRLRGYIFPALSQPRQVDPYGRFSEQLGYKPFELLIDLLVTKNGSNGYWTSWKHLFWIARHKCRNKRVNFCGSLILKGLFPLPQTTRWKAIRSAYGVSSRAVIYCILKKTTKTSSEGNRF